MGKGLARRRRLQNAANANFGNLHKAALGKASPHLPLAPAPKPEELIDKPPALLRKLMTLKEVASKPNKKSQLGNRKEAQTQGRAPTSAAGKESAAAAAPKHSKGTSRREEDDSNQPSTSGRNTASPGQPTQLQGSGYQSLFDITPKKTLKQCKKEYLKKKELKKKKGQTIDETPVEQRLKDHVKFGEQVAAPLEVHLKRKHFVQKSANERCKNIFLKQLQQAQQKAGALPSTLGPASDMGIALPSKKRKQLQQHEMEEVRQQAIDAYRARKRHAGAGAASHGSATMASLAQLVKKGSGAPGPAHHTLA